MVASAPLAASDLVITGVVDGPLSGGLPKAIEVYALNNIVDLSVYGVGSANNGNGGGVQEFTFPAVAVTAGSFMYVASESAGFTSFFGFAPDYTSGAASINGDDAIELFQNGFVVDVFGDINTDGTGQPWEHLDGWAYRADNTGPDCSSFLLANWSFSGPNALDGETTNGTAATPFPIGSFSTTRTDSAPCVQSTTPTDGAAAVAVDADVLIDFNEDVTAIGGWFDISCTASGAHTATVSGGPQSFTLDPDFDFDASETCTVTVSATQITDLDADDPPDNMPADFVFSFATASPPGGWVINEIHADPASGSDGDANGDGVRDSGDDEFVEIINTTGGAVDISGWTLEDRVAVRHTFPTGSLVADGCSIVVFGGGTPTGVFGNSLVQTASGGFLGLNNSGDDVTLSDNSAIEIAMASYGSEGGDNQSLTLSPDVTGGLPYVKHTVATGGGGRRFSPGTRADGVAFAGCAPAAAWVINEIHADPAVDLPGDANGDGTRSSSADEFVELINNTGGTYDISGWTLSDASGLRHTFPADTVLTDGCGVLVFGGGTPTGDFGRMPVQTASVGFLGLNNTGDTLTLDSGIGAAAVATYGSEGGDNQSLTLDPDVTGVLPYVKHSLATGSGGTLYSPGTRIDGSQFAGCPQLREIFEIQGDGLVSPVVGQSVFTQDNVVSCLATDGFFIQTPVERDDADIDTSNGIFVFTGAAPTVAVGDLVNVEGEIQEFFGLTEISPASSITVTGTGAVPPAVVFNADVPSPDPATPSCSIEYECYEGMLVEVSEGIVAASNQEFGSDPFAEIHVTAGSVRPFREPGIEDPGLPGLPVWDGNPEVFELDPDKLGLPTLNIPARSTFSAKGVIGFEFNHYELWPNELEVDFAPLPIPVRPSGTFETTVGSLNLFRLFAGDTLRLSKQSAYIRDVLRSPDILAVQEVDTLAVLQALADQIFADSAGAVDYTPLLVEGNDIGGIDVGFLVRQNIQVDAVTQLGADELFTFDDPDSLLHDRPPLLLEATCDETFPISVMVLHMRSLGGIDNPDGRTRQKRFEQAESVAQMVQGIQSANPDVNLVVIGDFNAFEFTDGHVDLAGIIKGDFDPDDSLACDLPNVCTDLVEPNLTDQVLGLPAEERYSFIFRDSFNPDGSRGDAQVLDHAMTSSALDPLVQGFEYGRGNADAAEELVEDNGTLDQLLLRASDHDGLVLYIFKDEDGDTVPDAQDFCPSTVIPETVPTDGLRRNRWALMDDDTVFDTTAGMGPPLSFDVQDTGGCSCEQIIDKLNLGRGQTRFGCSTSNMLTWTAQVAN
ncbi:MAG: lamin tail domain-containing protein [Gammaproteobacteria bacterium]|nr:lamin tail domain-containing protein [Gammaproteobacteria bacterium]MDH3767223.1 lamin tail domain-containing protein [Gammaproteobacteria bacterium]